MIQPTTCLFVFLTHIWFYPAVTGGDIHSLTYIYTAFSKPIDLPGIHVFTAMGLLDDRMIDYYDSSLKKKIPKQPWMGEMLDKDYWDKGTQSRKSKEQWFKVNLEILRDRMRPSNDTDLHILQWRHGCKAESQHDKSLKFISGKDEYSYDGNDYLSFDDVHKRWIAPVALARPTKQKWDEVKMLNDYTQGYLERECVNWLSKFVGYAEEDISFKNKEPDLYVYEVKSNNPNTINLHCLATGFYPKHVLLQILRNGGMLDQLDGMRSTGIRPNGDGTYQIMNRVEILRSDSANFSCEVIHPATNMHRILVWDHSIREAPDNNSGLIIGAIGGVAAVVLLLVGLAVSFKIYSGKNSRTLLNTLAPESKSETPSMSNESGNGSVEDVNEMNGNGSVEDVNEMKSLNGSLRTSHLDSGHGGSNPSSIADSSPESTSLLECLILYCRAVVSKNERVSKKVMT